MKIDRFIGAYRYLSNFYLTPVVYEEDMYPSVEHAYQAAKTLDPRERDYFTRPVPPGAAKRAGRQVTIRSDWELKKVDIMFDLVKQKFEAEPLRSQLLSTGDAELVEGNTWHDEFWGICSCPRHGRGQNHLGKILMDVRDELKKEIKNVS